MKRAALFTVVIALAACSDDTLDAAPTADVARALPKPDAGPGPVDRSRMVLVPAGTFRMGHASADPGMYGAEWKENELPQHDVTLDAFYIDRDEVTVAEYARFLEAYGDPSARDPRQLLVGPADAPIAFVSWFDAFAFCAFAGKSLPTEAQWERAAKGSRDDRRFPWGDDGPSCSHAVFTAQARCEDGPVFVGSRSPAGDSAEGAHDLAGNVAEWVLDWYGPYAKTSESNPKGPDEGTLRVIRGGSASDPPPAIRTTARSGSAPNNRARTVGFRCVTPA